ncbi:unnamed protein product, partial [Mycena citricolor]
PLLTSAPCCEPKASRSDLLSILSPEYVDNQSPVAAGLTSPPLAADARTSEFRLSVSVIVHSHTAQCNVLLAEASVPYDIV